jgi:putative ABC transport system ATP-binding protein
MDSLRIFLALRDQLAMRKVRMDSGTGLDNSGRGGVEIEYSLVVVDESLAVRCRGVTKTYEAGTTGVLALRGVDLDARSGEILLLVGPSGSGKTTLISIVSGLLNQDEGECEVLGNDVRNMKDRERARFRAQSIGFVFQAFNLLPALNLSENVAVPLLLRGQSRKSAMTAAAEVLGSVGLSERIDALPAELSGGEQQRVAIARAIVHRPQLIVCDEPTSNLDHETGQEMMRLIRSVGGQSGRCVIIVTHDTRILEFADRVARIEDGKIVSVGIPAVGELL